MGYETCGLEFFAVLRFAYPAFIIGLLIKCGMLFRWKFPHYVWYIPLILCDIASCAFEKSLVLGIFCIISMLALLSYLGLAAFDSQIPLKLWLRRIAAVLVMSGAIILYSFA